MTAKAPVNSARILFKDRNEFRSFHTGHEQSFATIAWLYGVALCALLLVWAAGQLPYAAAIPLDVLAFIIIGWAQYSLGNGLHEAVHYNLGNRSGDRWAALLTAHPVGLTLSYRDIHLQHHRFLGTTGDPELGAYTHFPKTKIALLLRFAWFVSGVPAIMQFLQQQRGSISPDRKRSFWEPLALLGTQAAIASAFWLVFGSPLMYVVFWVLPVATVGKLLSTTRLICEHGSPSRDWVVRSIDAGRLRTWLLGAFDFNYHAEHHLVPSVPFAQLERLHRLHRHHAAHHPEYRPFEGRLEFFSGGYLALLAHWFRILPWRTRSVIHPAG